MRKTISIVCSMLVGTMVACADSETTREVAGQGGTASGTGAAVGGLGGVGGSSATGAGGGIVGGGGLGGFSAGGMGGNGGGNPGGSSAGGMGGNGGGGGNTGGGDASPLGPGALHFVGVNSDIPEGFALAPLVDVPGGTQLRFTERAWNATTQAFEALEGTATLTLSTDLTAGAVFEITVSPPATLTVTPDIGALVNDGTGNWGIAGNGDNLFVYIGADSSPTFIAGIAFSSPSVWTTDDSALDGQSSMIPASLSEAAGTITTFTPDNLRYDGTRTGQGTMAAYLPLIANETNYETGTAAYTPLRGSDFSP